MGYHYGPQVGSIITWPHPLPSWNIFIILLSNGCLRATFTLNFYSPFLLVFPNLLTLSSLSSSNTHTCTHTHTLQCWFMCSAAVTQYEEAFDLRLINGKVQKSVKQQPLQESTSGEHTHTHPHSINCIIHFAHIFGNSPHFGCIVWSRLVCLFVLPPMRTIGGRVDKWVTITTMTSSVPRATLISNDPSSCDLLCCSDIHTSRHIHSVKEEWSWTLSISPSVCVSLSHMSQTNWWTISTSSMSVCVCVCACLWASEWKRIQVFLHKLFIPR